MARPAKHALTVLASPELRVANGEVKKLQSAAVTQFKAVAEMESNTAKAGILVGITLHRVKASMPGEFREWVETMLPKGNKWTPKTAVKNASFYMRLALVFLEKTKLAKADVLAVGDRAALDLGDVAAAKTFVAKLETFVGEHSLNELLIKHDIKSVGLKTALIEEGTEEGTNENELTPAQKLKQARELAWQEAWTATETLIQTLTAPEKIQLLSDAKQIETLKGQLQEATKLADERLNALRKK